LFGFSQYKLKFLGDVAGRTRVRKASGCFPKIFEFREVVGFNMLGRFKVAICFFCCFQRTADIPGEACGNATMEES